MTDTWPELISQGPGLGQRAAPIDDQVPTFFVPFVTEEKREEAYVAMARTSRLPLLPLGERIYSITFKHDGATWTATIGRQLTGSILRRRTSRARTIERENPLFNRSTVVAIFAGRPFQVWHDGASPGWSNPFFAGEPSSVTRFAAGR